MPDPDGFRSDLVGRIEDTPSSVGCDYIETSLHTNVRIYVEGRFDRIRAMLNHKTEACKTHEALSTCVTPRIYARGSEPNRKTRD